MNIVLNDVTIYEDEIFKKRTLSLNNGWNMLRLNSRIYREKAKLKPIVAAVIIATYYLAMLFSFPLHRTKGELFVAFIVIPAIAVIVSRLLIEFIGDLIYKIIAKKNLKNYYLEDEGLDELDSFVSMMMLRHDIEVGRVTINHISENSIKYSVLSEGQVFDKELEMNIVYSETDSEQILKFCHDHVEISLPAK